MVIVGGSLAGIRAAQTMRLNGYDGEVMMISDEVEVGYDRPPLSKEVLTGKFEPEQTFLLKDEAMAALDLRIMRGQAAESLDLANKQVIVGGSPVPYARLLIATGSRARRLPFGQGLGNVFTLRTLNDAREVRKRLEGDPRVVIAGFGFIGCEVAASLSELHIPVTIIDTDVNPLGQFGPGFRSAISALHQAHGVDMRFGVGVQGVYGARDVERVELTDGTVLDCDLLIMGVGAQPNVEWLASSGLTIDDGVVCDATLRAAKDVYAAGDVASWVNPAFGRRMRVEHWTNASEQAQVAARNMVGSQAGEPYGGLPYFWSVQYGSRFQYLGDLVTFDRTLWMKADDGSSTAIGLCGKDGALVGVTGIDGVRIVMSLRQQIASRIGWNQAIALVREKYPYLITHEATQGA